MELLGFLLFIIIRIKHSVNHWNSGLITYQLIACECILYLFNKKDPAFY